MANRVNIYSAILLSYFYTILYESPPISTKIWSNAKLAVEIVLKTSLNENGNK